MILEKNIEITAEQKEMMANKAIELMVDYTKITNDKNVLTCFNVENTESPIKQTAFNPRTYQPCVAVPPDIVDCIHEKFTLKGYHIYVRHGWHVITKREMCPVQ